MRRVRLDPQCVDDPQVKGGQRRLGGLRQRLHVGRIGECAASVLEPVAGRIDVAVILAEIGDGQRADLECRGQLVRVGGCRVERRAVENIVETPLEDAPGTSGRVAIDGLAGVVEQLAEIVDAVAVVGVVVSVEHCVDGADVRGEELVAQVRTGIDKDAKAFGLDQDRGAGAAVARVGAGRRRPSRCRSGAHRSRCRSRGIVIFRAASPC